MPAQSKAIALFTSLAAILVLAVGWQLAQGDEKKADMKYLRHVVLFKFKESAKPADIKAIEDAFRALPNRIDSIVDFEWGTNNSPEGINKGFTHCFFVSFADEEGRQQYLPHPAHQEFVTLLKPSLDDVLVVDYWSQQ